MNRLEIPLFHQIQLDLLNSQMKILLIDNFDSFTFNLVDYFQQLGVSVQVKRNTELLEHIDSLQFDAIVLSPGPGKPIDAGNCMQIINKYYTLKPILGICLGQQAIGEFFGWTLKKSIQPMHGKTSLIYYQNHALFSSMPNPFVAMRYHSLVVEKPTGISPLKAIASTADGEAMVIIHSDYPIIGIQFHPESVLTREGIILLRNWLSLIR